MPELDLIPGGALAAVIDGFELSYADDGGERRVALCHVTPSAWDERV